MKLAGSLNHSDAQSQRRIRAAWLVTGIGEPIRGGCIVVRCGRVVSVEPSRLGPIDIDLEDSILMPGLINSHTHLEFSGLERPLSAEGGFVEWVGKVIAYRQNRWGDCQPEEQIALRRLDLQRGLEESSRQGTVALADIATSPYPMEETINENSPSPSIQWGLGEVLGWKPERQLEMQTYWAEKQHKAESFGQSHYSLQGDVDATRVPDASTKSRDYRWGISPHAPYSTSPKVIQWCIERSRCEQRLLAMHLGETVEEMEWLRERRGAFAELLEKLGVGPVPLLPQWRGAGDYLQQLSRSWRSLIVHGNYLPAEDWEILVKNRDRMSVVFCPRTHRYFGHSRYPLREMRETGVRVIIGTDSRASNPDLSVWRELQTIANSSSGLRPRDILGLATIEAAEALGIAADLGSIQPGKLAHFAVAKATDSQGQKVPDENFWEQLWDGYKVALPQSLRL